jgi:Aspartyl protease
MKRWLAGFILAGLLPSVATRAQTDSRSIPFTVSSETSLLMIPVSVGGDTTIPFVLDTGSGVSVLSQSLVDKLGGKATGRFTGFRLTGERIDLQLSTTAMWGSISGRIVWSRSIFHAGKWWYRNARAVPGVRQLSHQRRSTR